MQTMRKIVVHALFIVALLAAGFAIGAGNPPGPWFEGLSKPPFQPPAWLFAPVWSLLYVLIAVAGARTWLRGAASRRMWLWLAQMALNLLWSPAFFGQQSAGLGLAVIVPLLALIAIYIAVSWRSDRVAALLFVPYGLWVAFASLLNASILVLN